METVSAVFCHVAFPVLLESARFCGAAESPDGLIQTEWLERTQKINLEERRGVLLSGASESSVNAIFNHTSVFLRPDQTRLCV